MKNILLITLIFSILIFTSCEKDKDNGENDYTNHFKYEGKNYLVDGLYVDHMGFDNENNCYFVDIDLYSKDDVDGNRVENWFDFRLFSTDSTLVAGTYTYSSTPKVNYFGVGEFGSVVVSGSGTQFEGEIKSGTISIAKSGAIYEIIMNCKDENQKSVTGYYKGAINYLDTCLLGPKPEHL